MKMLFNLAIINNVPREIISTVSKSYKPTLFTSNQPSHNAAVSLTAYVDSIREHFHRNMSIVRNYLTTKLKKKLFLIEVLCKIGIIYLSWKKFFY